MEDELEKLEHKYFLLEMQDHWDSEDYRYANELKERIKELRGVRDGKSGINNN